MTYIDLQGRLPIASLFTFDFRTVVHRLRRSQLAYRHRVILHTAVPHLSIAADVYDPLSSLFKIT